MFHNNNRARTAGMLGMFGAALFFVGLLIEYHYGLFSPGSGMSYVIDGIIFQVAMICMLVMLWGLRGTRAGSNGRFARITLTVFPSAGRC